MGRPRAAAEGCARTTDDIPQRMRWHLRRVWTLERCRRCSERGGLASVIRRCLEPLHAREESEPRAVQHSVAVDVRMQWAVLDQRPAVVAAVGRIAPQARAPAQDASAYEFHDATSAAVIPMRNDSWGVTESEESTYPPASYRCSQCPSRELFGRSRWRVGRQSCWPFRHALLVRHLGGLIGPQSIDQ